MSFDPVLLSYPHDLIHCVAVASGIMVSVSELLRFVFGTDDEIVTYSLIIQEDVCWRFVARH